MPATQRIYLDANATTPLDPRVRDAMVPWLGCGNASSPHAEGRAARAAIDDARDRVAELIGAQPREIFFTSGATEANALALLGAIDANGIECVFCSAVEHPSVLRTLQGLAPRVALEVGTVDSEGRLIGRPSEAATLVSVMLANNETGSVQPVREVAAATGAIAHCDAAQACGKMRVDVRELGVDLLTLSAHKMHGPAGAGALFVRRGARLSPLFHGGEHERGLRSGTENVAAIVGLGAAAKFAAAEFEARRCAWTGLRDEFLERIRAKIASLRINSPADGLPNTISLTIGGVEGEAVLLALDLEGIAIATGSACSSGAAEPSHVLSAIGLTRQQAEQSVRISLHAHTTREDLLACADALERAVKKLRSLHV
ncbi:MAG: cysteine desulfurase family protein [Planctomycetota bacterium]